MKDKKSAHARQQGLSLIGVLFIGLIVVILLLLGVETGARGGRVHRDRARGAEDQERGQYRR